MAIDAFDTITLIGVLDRQEVDDQYWLQFFGREITFTTEKIMFDEIAEDKRLAPFVAPNVKGRVMREFGSDTKTFKPAYVKPKHFVDPNRQFSRTPGESLGTGTLTPGQRFDARVAYNLGVESNMIERRLNWMGAQAIQHGFVRVEGEDYPPVTVDFGRDASLTGLLTGLSRWGYSGADPLADIALYRKRARLLSGARISRITMGEEAYDKFYENDKVQELLRTDRRTGNSELAISALGDDEAAEYKGRLIGGQASGIEIYTYSGFFHEVDDDGGKVQVSLMDPNMIVGTGNAIDGVQCFGAIRDKQAQLRAIRKFPKTYDEDDPSGTYTMTQSAPLLVPVEPNNTFAVQVDDPE